MDVTDGTDAASLSDTFIGSAGGQFISMEGNTVHFILTGLISTTIFVSVCLSALLQPN